MITQNKFKLLLAAAAATVSIGGSSASAATFTPFSFVSNTSTSGTYDPTKDVRLDSVGINGQTYSTLQFVSGATIVLDDGVDVNRGGNNFAAGRGPNSVDDTWATQGPATVTPTSADLQAALGNNNLTSLAITREAIGTAILDVTFANPTNTFFFYERGSGTVAGNSSVLVEALNAAGNTIGAYKVQPEIYTDTGLVVSTDVGAFSVLNVKLGSVGLQLDDAVSRLRLISTQASNFQDAGPDYKILAADGVLPAVPEPTSAALLAVGGVALLGRRRRSA